MEIMIVFISIYKLNDDLLYLIFYGYCYRLFSCSQKIGKLERTIQNDTVFWTSMLFHANVSFSKKN